MLALLVGLFVISGMAGLIYESIWARYLGLFVGHSAYAQIVVLVIFLGGMSVGALAVGRRSERIRDPLIGYAAVEAIIGVLGLAFHPLFVAATNTAYDTWFPRLTGTPWLHLVEWSLAGSLILPQSILLGTTFPLMSAAVLRRAPKSPGSTLALLYFANSFGASIGALLSGFVLIGALGLPGTVATAGALNLLIASTVAWIATRSAKAPVLARPAEPRRTPSDRGAGRGDPRPAALERATIAPGLLISVSFGTAVASFIYEIGWIRMLSLVLGSATRSFELMLSAFILGLALGSLWVRARADRFRSPIRALGILQWAMGSLALLTLPVYLASFHWMTGAMAALPRDDSGYRLFTLLRYGICLAVMLPATFCAGTTLPLLTRSLMAAGSGERAIGLVYGVNTLGSIAGAAAAGLVLMPLLGLKGLLVVGAVVDVGLGMALLLALRGDTENRRLAGSAAAASAVVIAAVTLLVRFDPLLLSSGVYRSEAPPAEANRQLRFYHDGRTASVSVERDPNFGSLTLRTNGKPDASIREVWLLPPEQRPPTTLWLDEPTQTLLALASLAYAPRARTAAVIGQGSGMTSHHLLGSPLLAHLTTIEIEPEMIRASRQLLPANRRVFEDPRSEIVVDDAKSYFAAAPRRFDLVISEPSNPWVSGVAGLFSTEFYHRLREHLSPNGVFAQWIQVYELDDDLVLNVLAALHQNFSSYQILMVGAADLLVVATNRPEGLVPDWSVFRLPAIANDLANLPPFTPDILEALRVADRPTLAPLIESGLRANSDYHPVLDQGAEKARFLARSAGGFLHLHEDRFSLPLLARRRPVPPIGSWMVPAPAILRLGDLSASAALRSPPPGIDPAWISPRLPPALERRARFQSAFTSGTPPSDWMAWTRDALIAEDDWHRGTAGTVDENLYALLRSYMAHAAAPGRAVRTLGFLHDMATWNLPAAGQSADSLIAWSVAAEEWFPAGPLLDAAVAARLLAGDTVGARRALEALAPLAVRDGRDPHDLRTRLLAAWVDRAERARAPAPLR